MTEYTFANRFDKEIPLNDKNSYDLMLALAYPMCKTIRDFLTVMSYDTINEMLWHLYELNDDYLLPLWLHLFKDESGTIRYRNVEITGKFAQILDNESFQHQNWDEYVNLSGNTAIAYENMSRDYLIDAFCERWRRAIIAQQIWISVEQVLQSLLSLQDNMNIGLLLASTKHSQELWNKSLLSITVCDFRMETMCGTCNKGS